ncbi:major capsid protein [Hyphomonas pacifica]|nr:major capsid protein [Hyphomonas pacifica]
MEDFNLEAVWSFTARHLTQTVNQIPNVWGYLGELNYAPGEGVDTTVVEIARTSEGVRVLPAVTRGGPASTKKGPKEDAIYIEIPSFPQTHTITPGDVQDWLKKANREINPVTLEQSLADRLESLRKDHDYTLEYQRVGSAKGKLIDGAGNELLDLFEAFGVVQKTVDFALDDPTTNVRAKCNEVKAYQRANLQGETMSGAEMLVDSGFFDAFVEHPNVEKYWLNHVEALALAHMDAKGPYGREFTFGGLHLREYDASVNLYDGSAVPMIGADQGHAFPVGTQDAWQTYFGPPHDIRFANAGGLEIYMSQEMLKHGAGVELKSESCPLAVFRRPNLLVGVTA